MIVKRIVDSVIKINKKNFQAYNFLKYSNTPY